MFLQSVGVSPTELFNLVSNVWYVEIVVPKCVEVFVLRSLNWMQCAKVGHGNFEVKVTIIEFPRSYAHGLFSVSEKGRAKPKTPFASLHRVARSEETCVEISTARFIRRGLFVSLLLSRGDASEFMLAQADFIRAVLASSRLYKSCFYACERGGLVVSILGNRKESSIVWFILTR